MEPSVNETASAAIKTGEVCTSVLSGTTAQIFVEHTVSPNQSFGALGQVGRHTAIMIWIS
jgi:hypothetical protein